MKFPHREAEVLRLARDLAAGLKAYGEVFPNPPVGPEELEAALAKVNATREAVISAQAQRSQGIAAKDEAVEEMVDLMKADIRYAENTVRGDDGKLQLIGWGGRRGPSRTDAPGQVRALEVVREGKDWIYLDWKEPTDGGAVSAYQIQRRQRNGDGGWINVAMSVESEVTLNDQEAGLEFEYQVVARNKAGEGLPSNIVRAVL